MAHQLTTTKGECRSCGKTWPVERTPIGPDRLRTFAGMSYYEGLPRHCTRCNSIRIAYHYDQQGVTGKKLRRMLR